MRLSIRHQIVGPFVVLVVFVGVVGTAVVTTHFTQATGAAFDGSLLRSSMLANDHLAIQEADRLQLLRAAADTQGVAEAVRANDNAGLLGLLSPVLANAGSPELSLHVLDRQGIEVLRLQGTREIPTGGRATPGYAGTAAMQAVLGGRRDASGDKYAFLYPDASGPVLFWAGPIRAEDLTVTGAIVLGEPLASVASSIEGSRASDLAFFDPQGRILYSSLAGQAPLASSVLGQVLGDRPARIIESVGGHSYGLLVSDWRLRGRSMGYLGVALAADDWQASLAHLRFLLVILFAAASLLALLIGATLARYITQPIDRLVRAMRRVAAGDLRHRAPAGPANEIGYLTATFNEMTAGLEQRTQQLERTVVGTLEALVRALDARDSFTFERSTRIAAISNEIAQAIGLPAAERQALQRSALLHDIGEIGIDDRIRLKPGPLTEEEYAQVKRHPVIGHEMLTDLPFLATSLPGVRHHHERWDGTGYPDGLKGSAIPLPVRILTVADAFDAMTSDRAHRKGFSIEFAARALRAGAGSQFDPAVVDAFESRAEVIIRRMRDMGRQPAPRAADIRSLEEAM